MSRHYIDVEIQPRSKMNEVNACKKMILRNDYNTPTILLADRGYGSLNLFETIKRTDNLEYLFRVKNDFLKELKDLPLIELDQDISFEIRTTQTNQDKIDYKNNKAKYISGKSKFGKYKVSQTWDYETSCKMTLRVVRFKLSDNTYETIITSLPQDEFPLSKIKELYHLRWGIETSYRELKYDIGLINIHSKKEEFIKQEIYARLIAYNLYSRMIMSITIKQDSERKHSYQVNFTIAIYICRDALIEVCRGNPPPNIEQQIQKYILPVREGRSDKRKLKSKSVVYFLYRVA